MVKNYLKIAFRNLIKYKIYTGINILGLAIAMAACLLIYLFINHENSFDRFHQKADQIYRLTELQSFTGITPQRVALSMFPMGPALKEDYPEIVDFTRYWGRSDWFFRQGEKEIFLNKLAVVDSSFFSIFDFELAKGDERTALIEPRSIVLSEETAEKFFPSENPIGKQITIEDTLQFQITGVVQNPPKNSHLQFEALVSISTFDNDRRRNNWGSNFLITYLQLTENADISKLEADFPNFLTKHISEEATEFYQLFLQPLTDVHLGSTGITHDYLNWQKFNRDYIYIFSILAIFVLLIASINFMNLSTARSVSRAKEVGIRKTIGARRLQLARQFVGESVILAVIAAALALLLAQLFLPMVNNISARSLSLNLVENPLMLPSILGIAVLIGILSGIYPALFLSAFQPVKVLKGVAGRRGRKSNLRSVLVITQFAIAIVLIAGTFIAAKQLKFMRDYNPGFNKNQAITLPMSDGANVHYKTIKTELRQLSSVLDVTASMQRLGNNIHQMGARFEGIDEGWGISNMHVDFNYISFYDIEIVEGREFSEDISTDLNNAFILNEALVKKLNWENPLSMGAKLSWRDSMGTVIGVMKNFHFNSLHHTVEPLMLSVQDWNFNEMSIRISPQNIDATLQQIETVWNRFVSDQPFHYTFLDAHFETLYQSDQQASQVVSIVAVLAIIIACLGLFGLASISTAQRTKEIGIRKVLGASISSVIALLSREFLVLVFIANLIALPAAYWFMKNWLQDFAYQTEINWWIFATAGFISILIALLSVSSRAIKAARTNPAQAIRYE